MYRATIMIVVLSICTLPVMQAQAKSDNSTAANNKAGTPTIRVTKLDISDKALRLDYEIEMILSRTSGSVIAFLRRIISKSTWTKMARLLW